MVESLNTARSTHDPESLLGKIGRGGGLLGLGSIVDQAGRFLRNIILARLLAPEAFGLMATIMASIAAIEAVAEVGFRQSVIQNKKGADEEFLNVIWWLSLGRSFLLYAIAFSSAAYLAGYYGRQDSADALRFGFLLILLNGTMNPKVYVLEKEFHFKRWVVLMQGSSILGIIVCIGLTFHMRNVWALIMGFLTEALARNVLSYAACPFKPRFAIDRESLMSVKKFSKGMFGLPVLAMIFMQLDVFVIGKVLSFSLLGMYILAKNLAEMPNNFVAKIVLPVTLPAFSMLQDDNEKLKQSLLLATKICAAIWIPLFVFLIVYSKHILLIIYGSRYAEVAVPFGLLCVCSVFYMFGLLMMQVFMAVGRPNLQRTASIVRVLALVVSIYPFTLWYGLNGVSFSILLAMILFLITSLYYLLKIIHASLSEYFRTWLPGGIISLIILFPGVFIKVLTNMDSPYRLAIGLACCLFAWTLAFTKLGLLKEIHSLKV
jgi:lipopolysaccharide exporter